MSSNYNLTIIANVPFNDIVMNLPFGMQYNIYIGKEFNIEGKWTTGKFIFDMKSQNVYGKACIKKLNFMKKLVLCNSCTGFKNCYGYDMNVSKLTQ